MCMKIFSDIRILLNILYSYGIKLLCSYQTKKKLDTFLIKYSEIYGIKLLANVATTDSYYFIELDLITFNEDMPPIAIYTIPPYHNSVWSEKQKKFLDAYKKGQWKVARFYINGLPNVKSSGLRDHAWRGRLAKYYDAMLTRMENSTPNDWNGIFKIIES